MFVRSFIYCTLFLLSACGPKPRPLPNISKEQEAKSLLEWNKEVLANEVAAIEVYLKQTKQPYTKTETGLYIYDNKKGLGSKAVAGDQVWVEYRVSLLDGTLCFRTDSLMPETFVMGQNRMPSGLNEGLTHVEEGGSIKLVVPHYLLHGIAGDRKNIPPLSPVVYHLKLLKVEKR